MVRFPSPRPGSPPPEADVREVKDSDELMVAERVLVEGYPMLELEPLKTGGRVTCWARRCCSRILGFGSRGWTGNRRR